MEQGLVQRALTSVVVDHPFDKRRVEVQAEKDDSMSKGEVRILVMKEEGSEEPSHEVGGLRLEEGEVCHLAD